MSIGQLRSGTATVAAVLLCYGILTLWAPGRSALAVYQAGAFGMAAVWAARTAAQPADFRGSPALLLAAAPIVCGLAQLSASRTLYRWETWNAVLNWSVNWILFGIVLQFAADERIRHRFLHALLYFAFGLSAVSTVQLFTSGGSVFWLFPTGYTDLVMGPFVYRNQYAAFIETMLPLALYQAIHNGRQRLRYSVIAGAMAASVIAGASRAGSALVLAEVIVISVVAAWRGVVPGRKIAAALGQLAAVTVVFTVVVGVDVLARRFQENDPYAFRRKVLSSSVNMIRERPWAGFGMGTWSTAYPAYALYDDGTFVNQAHNDWVQWAVEGGVPLAAAMLALSAFLAVAAWRSLWGLGVISVLLHSFVDYPMQQRPALAGWFFAVAGAVIASGMAPRFGGTVRSRM